MFWTFRYGQDEQHCPSCEVNCNVTDRALTSVDRVLFIFTALGKRSRNFKNKYRLDASGFHFKAKVHVA